MTEQVYLRTLSKYIPDARTRREVMQEYEDHMEDSIADLMKAGMSREKAEEETLRQMGDPVIAGKEMGQVYTSIFDLRMLRFFLGMGAGLCVFYAMLVILQYCTTGSAEWGESDMDNMRERVIVAMCTGMGILLMALGFFWSAVEKWRDYDLFYAWGKYWNGGGVTNSAVISLMGIGMVGIPFGLKPVAILVLVLASIQFLQRAGIEWYRNRRKTKLLWEIGFAETAVFPYQGKGRIHGKRMNIITEGQDRFPAGWPFLVISMEGMTPVVQRLDPGDAEIFANPAVYRELGRRYREGLKPERNLPKERSAYWYLAGRILLLFLAAAAFWSILYVIIWFAQ